MSCEICQKSTQYLVQTINGRMALCRKCYYELNKIGIVYHENGRLKSDACKEDIKRLCLGG